MRAPRPITSRGRYLRNCLARATRASKVSNSRRLGRSSVTRTFAPSTSAAAAGFGQADFGPRRARRRLAVGQIDDSHAVALLGQLGQRAAAGDFHVVGMGPDGDHI